MPFCPSCGNQVSPNDRYCAHCGSPQPLSASSSKVGASSSSFHSQGMSARSAATLCYVPFFGWIFGLFVLASEKFRREETTRFHAFQGLYLFVTWLLIDLVLDHAHIGPFSMGLDKILKLGMIATWIYMLIQTNQGQMIRLPFLSELADRSVNEQR